MRLLQEPTGKMDEQGEPTFARKGILEWWKLWADKTPRAVSVVNGQFFNPVNQNVAPIAFSLRSRNQIVRGYGDQKEFLGEKKLLVLGQEPEVRPYNDDPATIEKIEHDAIVGLSQTAPKSPEKRTGRTMLGVDAEKRILIAQTSSATQKEVARILSDAGAEDVVMLDGGGSTQLVHRGELFIPAQEVSSAQMLRTLPQVLGIEAAEQ